MLKSKERKKTQIEIHVRINIDLLVFDFQKMITVTRFTQSHKELGDKFTRMIDDKNPISLEEKKTHYQRCIILVSEILHDLLLFLVYENK